MDINNRSIYGTLTWKTFGEGPLAMSSRPLTNQGFNEGIQFTNRDVRFSQKNDTVFAITSGKSTLSDYTILREIVTSLKPQFVNMVGDPTNTGKINATRLENLKEALAAADQLSSQASAESINDAKDKLVDAYHAFRADGRNKGGYFDGKNATDITSQYLLEDSAFTRITDNSYRFGRPMNWIVENFNIPNGDNGTKGGLDRYSGNEALMLGVWYDRVGNTDGDLSNARIYRKISLPAGTYYFGAAFNTNYNISNGYMFVAENLHDTADLTLSSIAYHPIADVSTGLQTDGLWFRLDKAQEIYVGFQADMSTGPDTQEFRAERVAMYRIV